MTADAGMDASPSWQELKEERDSWRRVAEHLEGERQASEVEADGWEELAYQYQRQRNALEARNTRLIQAGNALAAELEFWQGSERAPSSQEARDNWNFAVEAAKCDT